MVLAIELELSKSYWLFWSIDWLRQEEDEQANNLSENERILREKALRSMERNKMQQMHR